MGQAAPSKLEDEAAPLLRNEGGFRPEGSPSRPSSEGPRPSSASFEARVTNVCGAPCLIVLRALSALTIIAALVTVAVNAYAVSTHPLLDRSAAVRAYAAVFGVLVVLGEVNRPRLVLDYFKFLKSWPVKGAFVVLVGLLTRTAAPHPTIIVKTVAAATCALGAGYVLAGLICLPLRVKCAEDDENDDAENAEWLGAAEQVGAYQSPSETTTQQPHTSRPTPSGSANANGGPSSAGTVGGPAAAPFADPESSADFGSLPPPSGDRLDDDHDAPSWMDPSHDASASRLGRN